MFLQLLLWFVVGVPRSPERECRHLFLQTCDIAAKDTIAFVQKTKIFRFKECWTYFRCHFSLGHFHAPAALGWYGEACPQLSGSGCPKLCLVPWHVAHGEPVKAFQLLLLPTN